MDPNLFFIDYERLLEVLITIVILSFFIERALALLFESRFFVELTESGLVIIEIRKERGESYDTVNKDKKAVKGLKELISFAISVLVCVLWKFDAFSIILVSKETMNVVGMIITGAIIAGGSKGSIWLFKNIIGWMSSTEEARNNVKRKNP